MKTFHRIKRIFELPVSVVLKHGARVVARKFSRIGKVSLEKEFIPGWNGEKPQFPLALLRSHMTGSKQTADRILGHEFFILGKGPTRVGANIDWQKDYSGLGEPRIAGRARGQTKAGSRGFPAEVPAEPINDIKIVWELARFQFLPTLVHAYETTREEKYADFAKRLIHDFLLKNPLSKGIHWQSPLEVALRACNLALAWYFLKDTPAWKHEAWQKTFLTAIAEHGKFLLRNLEYGPGFNTNHLIGNFTGLFFLGILFPQFREARKWKAKARSGLEEQMEEQVGSDGVSYEASIAYHRFVTELFGCCALLARENEVSFSQNFSFRLEKMFVFIHSYTKPNGLSPMLGDSDDGRLFLFEDYFDWNPQDHTHLFWLEKELFQKDGGVAPVSRGFHDAHMYIMRKNDWYLLIHGGGIGQKGNGGHGHNDALSFELAVDGEDFIIDPGTYAYNINPATRRHFRSTSQHNTVEVDGEEQNRFRKDTVFGMHEDAHPQLNRWESTEMFDTFDGQHDGYKRLRNPVMHRRTIHFDKKKMAITITDYCTTNGRHELQWNFHFAPGVSVHKNGNDIVAAKNGKTITVQLPQELAPSARIHEDFVSPRYGVKEKAPVLTLSSSLIHEHPFHFTILSA